MGGKAALIMIIGFGFILGYISTNLSDIAGRSQGNMSSYAASTQSHNLAITAANVGLARLYQDTSWRGTVTQSLDGALEGEITYSINTLSSGRPFLRAIAQCTSADGVTRDTIEVRFGAMDHQSFTLFAWMTNYEGNVYWITGDTVWGRVHSNNTLRMYGRPVFMEKVTTARGIYPRWGRRRSSNRAIFKHGFETGVAPIPLPNDLAPLFTAAASGGRVYTGNVEVEMFAGTGANNDGYAIVSSGGTFVDSVNVADPTFNGVIAGTGRVSVQGNVDGRYSIASQTDVYILDDIMYANRDVSVSDDLLGLIGDRNVVVADNAANRSSCIIDASIFARSNSFTVENYSSGSPRGELYIKGSIVQKNRGPVGTFDSRGLKTGYYKRYRYDKRLEDVNFRPPYYPGFYKETYAISSWWESVHVPKFN